MKKKSTLRTTGLAVVGVFLSLTVVTAFQNCSGSSSGSTSANLTVTYDSYSVDMQIEHLETGMPSVVIVEARNKDGSLKTDYQGTVSVSDTEHLFCDNNISIVNGQGSAKIYLINNSGSGKATTFFLNVPNNDADGFNIPNLGTNAVAPARIISRKKITIVGLSPTARSFHSAIYDSNQKRMIVYGGRNAVISSGAEVNQALFNDVWSFNQSRSEWTQLSTTNAPTARYLHSAAYDLKRNRMLVFGGKDSAGNKLNDVWSLDLATLAWTQLSPTGAAPTARAGAGMYYDAIFDRAHVLTAGSTNDNIWSLAFTDVNSQGTWTHPTLTSGTEPDMTIQSAYDVRSSLAYVSNDRKFVLTPKSLTVANAADYSWISHTSTHPSDVFNGSLVFDIANNQTISLGGGCCLSLDSAGSNGNFSLNTLKLGVDGSTAFPISLHGQSAIYDPENLKMIVFGGETVSKSSSTPVTYSVVFNNDIYTVSLPRKDCPQ